MSINVRRQQRLVEVAQLYYEQNLTQKQISLKLGISRPMVSKMLNTARELGLVSIQVHTTPQGSNVLLNQLRNNFGLRGGVIVPEGNTEVTTNQAIAQGILDLIVNATTVRSIGFGWGYIVGRFVNLLEEVAALPPTPDVDVFPLIGNSSVSNRDYHSNEIVRLYAEKAKATPLYLHAPAFLDSEQEMRLFEESESYKKLEAYWNRMDLAIVNIGNYPSVPDYATATRFGNLLTTHKAVGRMLCYYFDVEGNIIHSDTDFSIQIPLATLSRCPNVVAVCSAALQPKALLGALRSGLFMNVIASESLIKKTLELH